VDNQTTSGQNVVMMAGELDNNNNKFAEFALTRNLEVTAMPYYENMHVSLARFTLQFHEVWIQRLLHFEHDAMYDEEDLDSGIEISNTVKYQRRALIGVTKEDEQHLMSLSFLEAGIKLRQQFFRKLNFKVVEGVVSAGGLSSIPLRDQVADVVGPISRSYHTLHTLGKKMPIPELDETAVELPEFEEIDKSLDVGEGLSGVILRHYKMGMIRAAMDVLRSSAAISEMLVSASESSNERIKRQNENAAKLSAGSAQGGITGALSAIGGGVWGGLEGAVMKPIEGAQAGGFMGFFDGVGQGAVGAVTKPVAGVVSAAKVVNDSYFKETQKLARIRMPRAVFGDHLLRSFDADNAATFWHLQRLEAQLREKGNTTKADELAYLKQNYMGFARIANPPGLGLLLTIDQLVLVKGHLLEEDDKFVIQQEIPMTHVTEAKVVGEDSLQIVTEPRGLKWLPAGDTEPATGRNLEHAKLAEALRSKTEFTKQEWEAFSIKDLRTDHFIKSGDSYFEPDAKDQQSTVLLLASARFKDNSWPEEDEGRWKKKKLTMLQETITRSANKALQKQRSALGTARPGTARP
jgi:hypothetical protein